MSVGTPALASVEVFPSSNVPTPSPYVVSVAGGSCVESCYYTRSLVRGTYINE